MANPSPFSQHAWKFSLIPLVIAIVGGILAIGSLFNQIHNNTVRLDKVEVQLHQLQVKVATTEGEINVNQQHLTTVEARLNNDERK
jgi:uncharacterized membrane-anchored protein YhcB (DUF1043 family)